MYRDTVKLPVGLIHKANQEGWLMSLSYLVSFKSLHKNNIIYNYSSRTLASKLGKSNSTVSLHVKLLISKGLAKMSGKNLIFLGEYKLVSLAKELKIKTFMARIPVVDELRLTVLRFYIILPSLYNQKRTLQRKSEIKLLMRLKQGAYISPADLRRLNKLLKKFELEQIESYKNYVNISSKGIAKRTSTSYATGVKMRQHWAKIGLIESKKRYRFVQCGASREVYTAFKRDKTMDTDYGRYLYMNGNIVEQLSNEVVVLNYKGINK